MEPARDRPRSRDISRENSQRIYGEKTYYREATNTNSFSQGNVMPQHPEIRQISASHTLKQDIVVHQNVKTLQNSQD
jgi:hypothetical protein